MRIEVVLPTHWASLSFLKIMQSKDGLEYKKKKQKVEFDYFKSYRFVWAVLTLKKNV